MKKKTFGKAFFQVLCFSEGIHFLDYHHCRDPNPIGIMHPEPNNLPRQWWQRLSTLGYVFSTKKKKTGKPEVGIDHHHQSVICDIHQKSTQNSTNQRPDQKFFNASRARKMFSGSRCKEGSDCKPSGRHCLGLPITLKKGQLMEF